MVQYLRCDVFERTTVHKCACLCLLIGHVDLELDESIGHAYELGVLALNANTAKNDVWLRILTLATDSHWKSGHAIVNLLRQLRVLVQVG